ncbi:MAG: peptidoglycan transglycosylase [Bacteroidetes bacterium]|jgi:monofunctional glycosyltransferase|nr:peptidoglycan transglycosylase [Bacteroidota bacterium]
MRILWKWAKRIAIFFFAFSIFQVVLLKFVPVYFTPLMFIRSAQHLFVGEPTGWKHKWVSGDQISKYLPQAVTASEDNLFLEHIGFDFTQIEKARADAEAGKRARGASTISQQTAKNVFLWPGRSFIRKGFEAYYTLLIELIWGKERIMTVYLNSIEMGDGIYGAEAVAQAHFGKSAKKLTRKECALIAATLPNPIRFNSAHPSKYIVRRSHRIMALMPKVKSVDIRRDE